MGLEERTAGDSGSGVPMEYQIEVGREDDANDATSVKLGQGRTRREKRRSHSVSCEADVILPQGAAVV